MRKQARIAEVSARTSFCRCVEEKNLVLFHPCCCIVDRPVTHSFCAVSVLIVFVLQGLLKVDEAKQIGAHSPNLGSKAHAALSVTAEYSTTKPDFSRPI
mmetsp:Transcript_7552/g.13848  ORF Transcript_7552/g.13848 Transcript_7552/m.13848 type:complete len:99 (+) Transcript_7552:4483-4779(+)